MNLDKWIQCRRSGFMAHVPLGMMIALNSSFDDDLTGYEDARDDCFYMGNGDGHGYYVSSPYFYGNGIFGDSNGDGIGDDNGLGNDHGFPGEKEISFFGSGNGDSETTEIFIEIKE